MRYNPLQIFKASKKPAGLYARKKWLGESGNAAWVADYNMTVAILMKGQAPDGSWEQSPMETIRHLFGLHLTVREKTQDIQRALDWLAGQTLTGQVSGPYLEDLSDDAFGELPWINARQPLVQICATLFLASVFGLEKDETVLEHYRLLGQWLAARAEEEDLWPEKMNILRAMIVHPEFSRAEAALTLIDELEKNQKPSGVWPAPVPFFLTLNALAHLDVEAANRQWQKALPLLTIVQKKDGSWGGEDQEWNTFLVVHALKNKKACKGRPAGHTG